MVQYAVRRKRRETETKRGKKERDIKGETKRERDKETQREAGITFPISSHMCSVICGQIGHKRRH